MFNSIAASIKDYTYDAFEEYETEDIQGLLTDRLQEGKKGLDEALQAVVTLCEVVYPQTREQFFEYFVYGEATPYDAQMQEREDNAEKRDKLYKLVNNLVRKYIDIANDMFAAGYTNEEAARYI